jgi:hypothetical protein
MAAVGASPLLHQALHPLQRGEALMAQQQGAEHGGEHHQGDGGDGADHPADLDQQVDLDHRQQQQAQE